MQPQMKSKEVHDNLVESDLMFDSFTEKVNQMEASVREGDVNPEQLLPLMASLKKSNMIKKRGEYMGLEIFVNNNNARKELPYKAPEQPTPIFKIIRKFIGQDIMKVSLPVILNEPFAALMRMCEFINSGTNIIKRAALHSDPVWRTALVMIGGTTEYYSTKFRKKKPFNAMLGETFEMVSEEYRFVAE